MKKLILILLTAISLSASILVSDLGDGWTYYTTDDFAIRCKSTNCQLYDWSTSKWVKANFNDFSLDLQEFIKDNQ